MPFFSPLSHTLSNLSRHRADPAATARRLGHMSILMRGHGAPNLPRVPTVFQRFEPLGGTHLADTDQRTPENFAQDLLARVVGEANMDGRVSHALPIQASDHLRVASLSETWHPSAPGELAYDVAGRPVCIYDPGKATRPGAVARTFIVQLAQLRLAATAVPHDYHPADHAHFLIMAGVFNGQGLDMLTLGASLAKRPEFRGLSEKALVAEIEHAAVLGMTVRGLVPEQMVGSYGPVLPQGFRKRIPALCHALEDAEDEVKILRSLCRRTACPESAQASLRTRFAG